MAGDSKPPAIGWDQIDKNIEETKEGYLPQWVNNVRQGGKWDYKVQGEYLEKYPVEELERDGNINYGATCVAKGFSPDTCLRAGGVVQGAVNLKSQMGEFLKPNGLFPNALIPWRGAERPWDDSGANSCYGDNSDDCENVLLGIRYGKAYMNKKGSR